MGVARLFPGCSFCILLVSCLCLGFRSIPGSAARGEDLPRAYETGELPEDRRLGDLKDLNGYFPFVPQQSLEEWDQRAEFLRRRLLVATGLWPMPRKTPDRAVVHGLMDMGDYTIEKVYLQSYPGHFVTGNLYRPKGRSGKLPGVLCPHGHWADGRFYDSGEEAIRQAIVQGAERFEDGGRNPIQSRCVQLVRMGCVVFHYDMVGYADSVQLAHRPSPEIRDQLNKSQDWGFFGVQAELRLQNMMGLQTYNSVRALDWFSSLPDVDPERLAVTGASGGGTQTFILCAIDPRPAVAFPAVMVSTGMQGGCTCENAPLLRIETSNVEIAALFAPRPLGMTAANDWTREIATKGYPELKKLYKMFGKEDFVMARPLLQFGHNYNYVSRAIMYGWMNKHLGLGLQEPIVEESYRRLTKRQLSVWDDEHPQPKGGDSYEQALLRYMTEDSEQQISDLTPNDSHSLSHYREIIGGAVDVLIGRKLPKAGAVEYDMVDEIDQGDHWHFAAKLRLQEKGEELPTLFLHPKDWQGEVVVWIDPAGKKSLFSEGRSPIKAVQHLLDSGVSVVGVDLLYQGEFLLDGKPITKTREVDSAGHHGKQPAAFTFGYNHSLFAQRVHDILTVVSYVKNHKLHPKAVHLVGNRGTGPLVAAAAFQAGDAVNRVAADTQGFRFQSLERTTDPNFWPGIVKYGDVPALLALAAPHQLLVLGEGKTPQGIVSRVYKAAAASDRVEYLSPAKGSTAESIAQWLVGTH